MFVFQNVCQESAALNVTSSYFTTLGKWLLVTSLDYPSQQQGGEEEISLDNDDDVTYDDVNGLHRLLIKARAHRLGRLRREQHHDLRIFGSILIVGFPKDGELV